MLLYVHTLLVFIQINTQLDAVKAAHLQRAVTVFTKGFEHKHTVNGSNCLSAHQVRETPQGGRPNKTPGSGSALTSSELRSNGRIMENPFRLRSGPGVDITERELILRQPTGGATAVPLAARLGSGRWASCSRPTVGGWVGLHHGRVDALRRRERCRCHGSERTKNTFPLRPLGRQPHGKCYRKKP